MKIEDFGQGREEKREDILECEASMKDKKRSL